MSSRVKQFCRTDELKTSADLSLSHDSDSTQPELLIILKDCMDQTHKLIPSVQEYIRRSFQSSIKFIADDTETEFQEQLAFYQKRVSMLQRKTSQLEAAVRAFAKRPPKSRVTRAEVSTNTPPVDQPVLKIELLPCVSVEGRIVLPPSSDRLSLSRSSSSSSRTEEMQKSEQQSFAEFSLYTKEENSRPIGMARIARTGGIQELEDLHRLADSAQSLAAKLAALPIPTCSDALLAGRMTALAGLSERLAAAIDKRLQYELDTAELFPISKPGHR